MLRRTGVIHAGKVKSWGGASANTHVKYGYAPDPRKMLPIETVAEEELRPTFIRPPCERCPDVGGFLDAIETSEQFPCGDFKGSFNDWEDLMTVAHSEMVTRGVSSGVARRIVNQRENYNQGKIPTQYKMHTERAYWRTFNNPDRSHKRVIPLPDKYRPHQLGEDAESLPNFGEINTLPDWAVKEEERLTEKGIQFKQE